MTKLKQISNQNHFSVWYDERQRDHNVVILYPCEKN